MENVYAVIRWTLPELQVWDLSQKLMSKKVVLKLVPLPPQSLFGDFLSYDSVNFLNLRQLNLIYFEQWKTMSAVKSSQHFVSAFRGLQGRYHEQATL